MKKQFPSPSSIVQGDEPTGYVDRVPSSFSAAPVLAIEGEDGQTVLEATRAQIPKVDTAVRGRYVFITGLNDVKQNERFGWVPFLNGKIPTVPVNKCLLRRNDWLIWVYLPVRGI